MYSLIELLCLFDKIFSIDKKLFERKRISSEYILKRNGYSFLFDKLCNNIVHNERNNEYEHDFSLCIIGKCREEDNNRIYTI